MSNLNNLVTKILDDAKHSADAIITDAKAKEKEIVDKKVNEANIEQKNIVEKAKIESQSKKERIVSNAQLQVRNKKLDSKQQVIDKVFEKSLIELINLSKEQYLDFIKNSILALPIDGDEELIVKDEDKSKIDTEFLNDLNEQLKKNNKKGEIKLSDEVRNIKGGFILYKNGIEINNSFESLVTALRDELEYDVVKILFN
ncbi:V-type ATP synthase subunit E [Haloimpatiens sp. FM7330]|uniref:V-type ATP synthase subunit E n=1 Tax=Haloimpatiens sp. FM7330 TaxID=3298610 RepID=UPI0036278FEF